MLGERIWGPKQGNSVPRCVKWVFSMCQGIRTLRRFRKTLDGWSQKFACLENFWNEKIFQKKFDTQVRVCEYFWLSSYVRLCSLKFQCARLPASCQNLTCLCAMPSILNPACFQRACLSALGQILPC